MHFLLRQNARFISFWATMTFSRISPERSHWISDPYKVWVTHGHNYYVSMGNETIKKEAIDRGVDIVLYGHTHRPVIDIDDDIIAVNPGSLSYPRQEGRQPSYAIVEIDRRGKVHFTIAYLRQ